MKYVGLQTQIWKNNFRSVVLLTLFPLVFFVLTWFFIYFVSDSISLSEVNSQFFSVFPWVTVGVGIWFMIAWFSHNAMINKATGSHTLERKSNKRVYNLVENLTIAAGMKLPKMNIIEDDSLNAFASGISDKTYTVSLSRGIISKLNDDELEGVIAHELTHIRNRDVRLLIVSIIFVGIFAFISEMLFRSLGRYRGGGKKGGGGAILILLGLALVGYLLSVIFRFALSRKREYMADAGAAQLTKNPQALATALQKVSADSRIEAVKRKDVAQLFIDNPQEKKKKKGFSLAGIFATHPSIEKRIALLQQF